MKERGKTMSYVQKIRTAVIETVSKLEANDKARLELEKSKDYSAEYKNAKLSELRAARNQIRLDARTGIDAVTAAYIAEANKKLQPKGEDITSDAKLLNAGLRLTSEELETLFDKYNGNPTMQRLVAQAAERDGVNIGRAYYTLESKKAAALDYSNSAKAALDNPLTYAFFVDRLTQIVPGAIAND